LGKKSLWHRDEGHSYGSQEKKTRSRKIRLEGRKEKRNFILEVIKEKRSELYSRKTGRGGGDGLASLK